MSEYFFKFKKRFNAFRIIKSALVSVSVGLFASGLWLMLIRLAVLNLQPLTALYAGLLSFAVAFAAVFLLSAKSDKAFAEELDGLFSLNARVQTMVEYRDKSGEMIMMQRADTDRALSEIPLKSYKFKRIWLFVSALVFAGAIFAVGFIVPDLRDQTPPVIITPFELSEIQEKGLIDLIKEIENSPMEDQFKTPIAEELSSLLEELRETTIYDDMIAAVTKSMAVISDITYKASTATEMLNALWGSGDLYFKYLAKAFAVSLWDTPDEPGFKEQMTEYAGRLMGDGIEDTDVAVGAERALAAIAGMSLKLNSVLNSSGLDENDEMYLAVERMFTDGTNGLNLIDGSLSDDEIRIAIITALDGAYGTVELNRTNSEEGEDVMMRLENLFLIPYPQFERPDFFRNDLSVEGGTNGRGDDEDEGDRNPGGIGGGAAFGSDDLVLDPMTGELVKYGELVNTYYGKMMERLENGDYTEEQKQAITKYFELLFSGFDEEEGK